MFALVVWAAVAQNEPWPNIGIHDGDNKIAWAADCCDGDTIVLDFRDEQADGNQGSGTLRLHNATDGTVRVHEIRPFWGMWKSFGPFCAPEGTHTMSFTSDANPTETTLTITDSFGLVRGAAGMFDFPISFNTTAPNKMCEAFDNGTEFDLETQKKRARKVYHYSNQGVPRAELEERMDDNPFDYGFTVIDA